MESIGASSRLALLWDPRQINLSNINNGHNWISGKVHSVNKNLSFSIFNGYTPTSTGDKVAIWNQINNLFSLDPLETFILGDFNIILDALEKKGGCIKKPDL